ncbi:glycoside hydrolase family 20 protein [Cesiribacter sp. SM1]|uniref:glycoside hydrolase family 20 protein n=1 Tax=Cesiribacter sp. SM1 TaxID=2861196 RepID=UPI001CD57BB3|nr:glycoside hydrolase family 20 protein [Cesiribacter sp. SM1]
MYLKRIPIATILCFSAFMSMFAAIAPVQGQTGTKEQAVSIIPQPLWLATQPGNFSLNANTRIYVDPKNAELEKIGQYLASEIKAVSGVLPRVVQQSPARKSRNHIHLSLLNPVDSLGNEGYTLAIQPTGVRLTAKTPQGLFLGTQTIRQLLPATPTAAHIQLPALEIADKARFDWRGMHLDVSRHFFPLAFIKQYIDFLAMHKMNTFHWHLTDDQGWRIEIKKYPKLTEVGAWRDSTLIGHYHKNFPHQYDGERYGGYYTQEQIREVVKYAQDRYITVVPEIEMPGHSLAALAAYPELSCTGGPFQAAQKWGIFEDVYCAGNEQTFEFLEDVLTEVFELFPSPYIHLGGDESPKARWKECPSCQARIKAENLEDEHELQSYFIQRMEKFVNANGRKIIGWDEILEGGLAPNATVMSWRGTKGGIAAAKAGHYVVMTPATHVYFDHYQGDYEMEPTTIGGFTPLQKVYNYEPIPAELTADEQKYILGAQANVWTEYMKTPEQVTYMSLPRMSALAEVLWTAADQKDWESFKQRMEQQYMRFNAMGINYSKSAYDVRPELTPDFATRTVSVKLENDAAGTHIYYTLDGTDPTPATALAYTEPFILNKPALLKVGSFANNNLVSRVSTTPVTISKAFGRPLALTTAAHSSYQSSGPSSLVNGETGTTNNYDGRWLGFYAQDMEAVIDLENIETISKLSSSYLQSIGFRIILPAEVSYAVSLDGKSYTTLKTVSSAPDPARGGVFKESFTAEVPPTKARYVKVTARNIMSLPDWHRAAGQKAWLFADEIVVE